MSMFFCLSGYVITKSLARTTAREFFIRRAARILPIYAIVMVLVGLYFGWEGCLIPAAYLTSFFWPGGNVSIALVHTWSLAIEEHFYLVWPWIFWAFSAALLARFIWYFVIATVILVLAWPLWGGAEGMDSRVLYYFDLFRLPALMLGGWLAIRANADNVFRWSSLASILIAVSTVGLDPNIAKLLLTTSVGLALVSAGVAGHLDFCMTSKPLIFLGKISYGLYLYHYPILIAVEQLRLSDWTASILGVSLSLIVATASWYLIEAPIQAWAKRPRSISKSEPKAA